MISQVKDRTVSNSYETNQTQKKSKITGNTIGEPKLSEKASKYYEELKNKYSNMDFILVSEDQKEQAQAQAGNYANANRMVVLIDEEKIEKMAEDKEYRKQYEGIIQQASSQMPKLQSSLQSASGNVKTYGIQVNGDGTASYFAVLKNSSASQKKRIAQKTAKKQEAKKLDEKKAAKKEREEQLAANRKDHRLHSNQTDSDNLSKVDDDSTDTIMVTAASVDELLKKISDYEYANLSDQVQTQEEKNVGQHIDFRM